MTEEYNPSLEKYGITREQWDGASKEQREEIRFYTKQGIFGNIQGQIVSDEQVVRELQGNLGNIVFPEPSSKVDLERLFGVRK